MTTARITYHADGSVTHPILPSTGTPAYMEHRLHARVRVFVPVRLRFCDGTRMAGVAANLSRGGMFIETPTCAVRRSCADICMPVPWRRGDCELRIPAFVVHYGNEGIGLMFRELDADTDETLLDLIHTRTALPGHVPPIPVEQGPPLRAPLRHPGR